MNILEQIKQDVANLKINKEVRELNVCFREYLVKLNEVLEKEGNISFDYFGGCVSSFKYLDFDRNPFVLVVGKGESIVTFNISSTSYVIEFKLHTNSKNLTNWSHEVKGQTAKADIVEFINFINKRIKEI